MAPNRPSFRFVITTPLAPEKAWAKLAHVQAHGDVVPLTRGSGPPPSEVKVGSRLVATTRLGPIGFDDVMIVRACAPGERLELQKTGRFLGGRVDIRCQPESDVDRNGTRVTWSQELVLPWLPGRVSDLLTRMSAPAIRAGYRHTVTRILAAPDS